MNQQPNKCSPLGPYEQMERLKRELAEALAIPKHMLGKSGFPTFMEPIDAEEMFPVLGPNDRLQKDGSIIKQCPKCLQKHTDTTVSHCEECQRKF